MADVLTADDVYPTERLEGLSTALVGFAAAFRGKQDCRWIAEAGIQATCVDIDRVRLGEMEDLYPDDWRFVVTDIFQYAETARAAGITYDLVSLDPYTNHFVKVSHNIDLWCAIAEQLVVFGTGPRVRLRVPAGWQLAAMIKRSRYQGGVYWAVLERC